ncbi:FecR family protein [Pseudomonas sp. PA1(2017)]|uniref:FecR family protein n=1 Tax=Pseudomonas sp. PA1(2017) TaxID=1932113 RepID=UPI0009F9B75B|nr:FecR family protein [Pseudomonas sp. PA1(2017)]
MTQPAAPEPSDMTLSQQANAWVARLTSGHATVEDAAALRQWCAQSEAHAAAYREATRLWRQAGSLATPRRFKPRRRLFAASAVAACLALAVVGGTLLGVVPDGRALLADHHTQRAEHKIIDLADGSQAELDAETRLSVDFSAAQRRLDLADGAALFNVQHDTARPFVVHAADMTVTAVGTVFEVRHLAAGISVTCTEGVVEVRQGDGTRQRIKAGEQVVYSAAGASPLQRIDSTRELAWREGVMVFRNRPLQELVHELNRYHQGRIVIASEKVAQMPVSGVFHLNRADEALRHIEQALQLSAMRLPAGVVVLR